MNPSGSDVPFVFGQTVFVDFSSRVHSPFLRLAGVALQNLTMDDINSHNAQEITDSSSSFHDKRFVHGRCGLRVAGYERRCAYSDPMIAVRVLHLFHNN